MTDPAAPGTTITCQEVVELVTDYLEGQLDRATRAEIEVHLSLCEGCATYLDQMRQTIRELGRVPVEGLSDRAQRDLLAAFRDYHGRPPGGDRG